jgi:hypothetical protein
MTRLLQGHHQSTKSHYRFAVMAARRTRLPIPPRRPSGNGQRLAPNLPADALFTPCSGKGPGGLGAMLSLPQLDTITTMEMYP